LGTRVRRDRALVDCAQARGPGQDGPSGCVESGLNVAGRAIDDPVGSRCDPRGDASPGSGGSLQDAIPSWALYPVVEALWGWCRRSIPAAKRDGGAA
jgi:hypothetical protein